MVLLCNGNEISWVQSYLGMHDQFGYEPVRLRSLLKSNRLYVGVDNNST